QDGGYTGMTPQDFRDFVQKIAKRVGFAFDKVILGGDHLGPNPWKKLPASDAMDKAKVMIDAFARAGFTKLHLDTSMGCAGEPVALADALTAERAASLAAVAEAATRDAAVKPVYIVGTEVPIPGGAMEEIEELEVTKPPRPALPPPLTAPSAPSSSPASSSATTTSSPSTPTRRHRCPPCFPTSRASCSRRTPPITRHRKR
ncbi:MAG: kbaZ 2, partial [Proteobacteria bacterium]|nr:kbaZ 2 [Pseudomonadota bacterium]